MRQAGITVIGVASLVRLRTSLTAPALTLIGWYICRPATAVHDVSIAAASSFFMIVFAQAFNDVCDRELDAVTKPERAIPSGRVSLTTALAVVVASAVLAVGSAVLVGSATVLICIIDLLLAAAYSTVLKSTVLVGNAIVALVSCTTLAFAVPTMLSDELVTAMSLVFIYSLGNELFKTGLDMEGDRTLGIATLATAVGLEATVFVVRICAGALWILWLTSWLWGGASPLFLIACLVGVLAPSLCGATVSSARGEVTIHSMVKGHRLWRLAWTPGVLALILI